MRFRVECTNPETRQHHEFELDGRSLRDIEQQLRDAGLVSTSVTPLSKARPRRFTVRRPAALRWSKTASSGAAGRRAAIYGALIVVVLAGLAATLGRRGEIQPVRRLNASVRIDGRQLTIGNTGDEVWHDVRIDLNGGLANRGYVRELSTLAPRQSMVFDVAAFSDEDGTTFNPASERLRQLRIAAETADGRVALYTRRWD